MKRDWRPRKSSTGAVCVTVASCYSLWALTWMQFVTAVWHGLPLIAAAHWSLQYHAHQAGPFPVSVPELWLMLAIALAMWAHVSVWLASRSKRGRWSMRFWVLIFSTFAVGFGTSIVESKDRELYWTRRMMWRVRDGVEARMAEFPDEPPERWEYDRGNRRFIKMKGILESVGGLEERTMGEATVILAAACAGREDESIELLHRHEDLIRKDMGVIPWKEAEWDAENEEWVFRVFYGLMDYVEARLPNWAVEPRLTVHNTSDAIPWSEVLPWRR